MKQLGLAVVMGPALLALPFVLGGERQQQSHQREAQARGNSIPRLRFALVSFGSPPFGQSSSKKQPVPKKEALDRAVMLIGELFRADLARAADDRGEGLKTAQTFLFVAKETNDDPAGKYVLLRESAALAASAGEAGLALQALEEMALSFDVPAAAMLTLKAKSLEIASRATASAAAYQGIVDAALALQDEALANDDFDNALPLGQTAETAAKKLKSVPMVSAVRKRNDAVQCAACGICQSQAIS